MRHTRNRFGQALALAVLAMSIGSNAHASPSSKKKAGQHFQKGVELYDAGDLRAALIEFRRAYKLMPAYQLLYNMAQAATELRDYVDAFEYYQQYLKKGGDSIEAPRRVEVEQQITRLEGYLATIAVRVSTDNAEIAIDGAVVGVSPLSTPLLVSAGRRRIVVTKAGHARWEGFVDLAGTDEEVVKVELHSLAVKRDATIVAQPMQRPAYVSGGMGAGFWASATITTLLAVGTGYAAYRTLETQDLHELELATVPNSKTSISRVGEDLRQQALITDIGLGLTAIGLLTTVILATSGDDETRVSQDRLSVQVGLAHVGLSGHF